MHRKIVYRAENVILKTIVDNFGSF